MQRIKKIFFDYTLKRWYFKDIIIASGLSRERVNYYLKILLKERFIKRVKPRGKMPYYIANRESERFRDEKRFYGLNLLQEAGLFDHLNTIKGVKSAFLFGSFSRGDFNKSSDIDLFIYGDASSFDKGKFETLLKREIQLLNYNNVREIKKELEPKLVENIFKGFNIKGSIQPFEVTINA